MSFKSCVDPMTTCLILKLKLFRTTLKDATLKWFMGLGAHSIRTWEQMKTTFLDKYKDYCMPHNLKYEAFKMMQK